MMRRLRLRFPKQNTAKSPCRRLDDWEKDWNDKTMDIERINIPAETPQSAKEAKPPAGNSKVLEDNLAVA
jgi:hypothetical protein